jgi:CO/xanthine dehydrogenase Mo-binding subunit
MSGLPPSLKANPRLSQWLAIRPEGRVEVRSGKVELGQGIATALAAIVAGELDVAVGRIAMVRASTAGAPNEGFTAGSLSVQDSGGALRQVCAEARAIYLDAAAQRLEVAAGDLEVRDGEIRVRGVPALRTSYWELADPALLDRAAEGRAAPKAPGVEREGELPLRLDLPDKVMGRPAFLHDMVLPGMLYARVAHPPSPGATLQAVDVAAVEALPGVVRVVCDGSFLGVIAEGDPEANRALRKLKAVAQWNSRETLPDMDDLPAFLRAQPVETSVVDEKEPASAAPAPTRSFRASYARPYLAHASIGPSCGLARWDDSGRVEVWTHAQGVYPLQKDLALLLRIAPQGITVTHVPGAGCYGHNGADDAAVDAALMARSVPGRPVQVLWTREDELACAPFGAAMAVDLQASVDADGRIVDWQHAIWSNGHSMRPGRMPVPVFHAAPLLRTASRRRSRSTCRWPPVPVPNAIRSRATPLRGTRSSTTACWRCRCARPRCARSARTATCSPPSASWTRSRSRWAPTRWTSACATWTTPAAGPCWSTSRAWRAGASARSAKGWARDSASPATRTTAPGARPSPRWKRIRTSGCDACGWRWTSVAWCTSMG